MDHLDYELNSYLYSEQQRENEIERSKRKMYFVWDSDAGILESSESYEKIEAEYHSQLEKYGYEYEKGETLGLYWVWNYEFEHYATDKLIKIANEIIEIKF